MNLQNIDQENYRKSISWIERYGETSIFDTNVFANIAFGSYAKDIPTETILKYMKLVGLEINLECKITEKEKSNVKVLLKKDGIFDSKAKI
jgi:ABC-type multidrug transport system fused ATPase/permease subunit